ncbi:hypothetical protein AB833_09620 [Chromatiales bacterium (ex Bugula neritina AB1)]|nr:hypothetical protein AB833_09620 [Chromatiales bacterium (ex Bugula neritina AB1)]
MEAAANNATPSAGIAIVASESVQMPELASQRGCAGCHSIDSVLLGPAWREVARRYLGNPEARALLIESVKNGGSGNWNDQTGGLPMPANFPTTSEAEIAELVDFILRLE